MCPLGDFKGTAAEQLRQLTVWKYMWIYSTQMVSLPFCHFQFCVRISVNRQWTAQGAHNEWLEWLATAIFESPANEAHKSWVAQSLEIQNLPAANGVHSYQRSKYHLLPKWWQSRNEYEWMVEWCRMVMHNILATKLTSFKWSKPVDPERHTSIETTTKNHLCFCSLSHCSPVILGPN